MHAAAFIFSALAAATMIAAAFARKGEGCEAAEAAGAAPDLLTAAKDWDAYASGELGAVVPDRERVRRARNLRAAIAHAEGRAAA